MKGLVKNCLQSIFESEINVPFEVIVVDNDSQDGIEEMVKAKYPQVRFIQTGRNLGMGGGNNAGIRIAEGRYVLILNPDIFVFKDSVQKMYNYIQERSDVGVVSPKLLNPDKTLQHTCYRWHSFWTPIYRRTIVQKLKFARQDVERFLMLDWDHDNTREVDWIQGSCLFIPKRVLNEVGLFDEDFFMYFEDTDLCRRINCAGNKIVYLAESSVIHLHRRQSADGGLLNILFNKLTRVHVKSWLVYMWKWRDKS